MLYMLRVCCQEYAIVFILSLALFIIVVFVNINLPINVLIYDQMKKLHTVLYVLYILDQALRCLYAV